MESARSAKVSTEKIIKCDRCEETKRNANHWLRFWVAPTGELIISGGEAESELLRGKKGVRDICGGNCALQELNEYHTKMVGT